MHLRRLCLTALLLACAAASNATAQGLDLIVARNFGRLNVGVPGSIRIPIEWDNHKAYHGDDHDATWGGAVAKIAAGYNGAWIVPWDSSARTYSETGGLQITPGPTAGAHYAEFEGGIDSAFWPPENEAIVTSVEWHLSSMYIPSNKASTTVQLSAKFDGDEASATKLSNRFIVTTPDGETDLTPIGAHLSETYEEDGVHIGDFRDISTRNKTEMDCHSNQQGALIHSSSKVTVW